MSSEDFLFSFTFIYFNPNSISLIKVSLSTICIWIFGSKNVHQRKINDKIQSLTKFYLIKCRETLQMMSLHCKVFATDMAVTMSISIDEFK